MHLQAGDAIVICDAGGGTVDLVSYDIQKLAPLELGELVRPTGEYDALSFRMNLLTSCLFRWSRRLPDA